MSHNDILSLPESNVKRIMREETADLRRPIVMKHGGIFPIILSGLLAVGVCGAQEPAFDSVIVKIADRANWPSPNERTSGGPGTSDPGHFYFANADMRELIMRAYGVKPDQVSGPCWILAVKRCADESVNFELSTTMPPGTTEERFEAMLRNLLATRFHLAVHHQTRSVPGYELSIVGGSVSPGRPVAPPGDQYWEGNTQPFGATLTAGMSGDAERAKFRARSMPDFAAILESMVGIALGMDQEKVGKPRITDKTGLTGAYTFNFGFSCPCRETEGYQFPGGLSNDPVGIPLPNIFDALRDQLGLKLVRTADVPDDVIVVDNVDKTPTN